MAEFVVRQPNGLLCRFSKFTNCPMNYNMTEEEYIETRSKYESRREAEDDIKYYIKPFNWIDDYFVPNKMMTVEEFEKIKKEMALPKDQCHFTEIMSEELYYGGISFGISYKSDYQDIYHIHRTSFSLFVNKFEYMRFKNDDCPHISFPSLYAVHQTMYEQLAPRFLSNLKILKEDYTDTEHGWSVPAGTVAYEAHPVKPVADREKWEYQIKTEAVDVPFHGTADELLQTLEVIRKIIARYQEQRNEGSIN